MADLIVLQTKLGKLRGRIKRSTFSSQKYYSFLGIPFGKPPIGEHRFKAPQPFGGWEGVRDALEDGNEAKQPVYIPRPGMDPNQETQGDEDCLYLCVYMNELPEEGRTKKPVMVNIHGGGFVGGSGDSKSAGPDYLMEGDVVLVSFNYRCGALGFLSLENEEVPGNAGLKDQTLALKWVQDNIESFGGDPHNVTIFGISAGGASVHYHLLSPLSKGLFHKAIMQSGWAQNPWALQPSPKKMAIKLAKRLGCESEDPHQVLEFLQSVPSDSIVTATKELAKEKEYLMNCGLVFSPCVEVEGSERFLPDTPNNLMKRGEYRKVPTIQGICQNEGIVHLMFTLINGISLEEIPTIINNNPELLVPSFLGLKHGTAEITQAKEEIWDYYFKGEPLSMANFSHYIEYQSDLLFNIGFGETRRYLIENSTVPTYSYLFTDHTKCIVCFMISSTLGANKDFADFFTGPETCHGADLNFIFTLSNGMPTAKLTANFKEAISRFVGAWTKFALTVCVRVVGITLLEPELDHRETPRDIKHVLQGGVTINYFIAYILLVLVTCEAIPPKRPRMDENESMKEVVYLYDDFYGGFDEGKEHIETRTTFMTGHCASSITLAGLPLPTFGWMRGSKVTGTSSPPPRHVFRPLFTPIVMISPVRAPESRRAPTPQPSITMVPVSASQVPSTPRPGVSC